MVFAVVQENMSFSRPAKFSLSSEEVARLARQHSQQAVGIPKEVSGKSSEVPSVSKKPASYSGVMTRGKANGIMMKEVPSKQPKEVKIRALTHDNKRKEKRVPLWKKEEVISSNSEEEAEERLKRKKRVVGLAPQTAVESLSKMTTMITREK